MILNDRNHTGQLTYVFGLACSFNFFFAGIAVDQFIETGFTPVEMILKIEKTTDVD